MLRTSDLLAMKQLPRKPISLMSTIGKAYDYLVQTWKGKESDGLSILSSCTGHILQADSSKLMVCKQCMLIHPLTKSHPLFTR